MHYLADTGALLADGTLTPAQARIIEDRSRSAMVALGVNTLLTAGILAAAAGFVFWLADVTAVAALGALFLAVGAAILLMAGPLYRMLGNAAALIGAGMLAGGATLRLIEKFPPDAAGTALLAVGALGAGLALWLLRRSRPELRFVFGALVVMMAAVHLAGLYTLMQTMAGYGWATPTAHLYATGVLLLLGYFLDLRILTALAIIPFAQVLDTSTEYFHAAYAFYSPEPTLSILQMTLALIAGLWLAQNRPGRLGRQGGMFAIMAFIVGNLCFLVGSLWGDVVGQSFWRAQYQYSDDWAANEAAADAFATTTVTISPEVYSVVWAIALAAALAYAMFRHRRGLFNATLTFGAIHAYTQLFESFGMEPLAFVIAGLTAAPLAWALWRINEWFRARQAIAG